MTVERPPLARAVLVVGRPGRRETLVDRVRAMGWAVEVCTGGGRKLATMLESPCDLVLIDLAMGRERAAAMCGSVRASEGGQEVTVVAVAEAGADEGIRAVLAAGADDFVIETDGDAGLQRRFATAAHRRAETSKRCATERMVHRLERALDAASVGLAVTDTHGHVTFANRTHAAMHGYTVEELAGMPVELFAPEAAKHRPRDRVREGPARWQGETTNVRKDGTEFVVELVSEEEVDAAGRPAGTVMTCRDITARRLYDPITGLPNRALVLDRLHQALERSRRPLERPFAVVTIELDRFSHITSSYGPTAADRLLTSVASRLKDGLRSSDTVTAPSPTLARVEGGRFTVLLHDVTDARDAVRVARRLQGVLDEPFSVDGAEVFTSASIGIVAGAGDYRAAAEVLRDVETAVSQARVAGGGAIVVFDPEMHARAVTMLKLENELRHAIERRELRVHYQPLLSLEDGALTGFEALVRWQHPGGRLLLPDEFIPLAEQTGLIVPLDRWVIDTVCRQIRAWRGRFGKKLSLVISANVSGRQFTQPDFTVEIDRSLRAHGLYGGAIKLEITESVIMEHVEFAAEMLSQLHDLDISLSIDDFGTGYSSFSYLRRFEIDTLKIDRSFVGRMDADQESAEIVRAIVGLGRSLGKNVVAEGVENCNQVLMLRDLGCPHAQGFYFAPALVAEEATDLIARQHVGDLFTV